MCTVSLAINIDKSRHNLSYLNLHKKALQNNHKCPPHYYIKTGLLFIIILNTIIIIITGLLQYYLLSVY